MTKAAPRRGRLNVARLSWWADLDQRRLVLIIASWAGFMLTIIIGALHRYLNGIG